MIEAIHTKVEGRARFRVEGLRGSEPLRAILEQRLAQEKDILEASASALTGTIRVSFNSNNNHHTIAFLLEDILVAIAPSGNGDGAAGRSAAAMVAAHAPQARQLPVETLKRFLTPPTEDRSRDRKPWHVLEAETVASITRSDPAAGLPAPIAAERLKEYGPNHLPKPVARSGAQIFLEQLNSLPVYLLGAAAGISLATGGVLDAAVIGGVVLANAVIGYFTESGAEKTMDALKELVHPTAEVIRGGREIYIPAEEVVVGDILALKPGTCVAADCRILAAARLSIDESMLTGESMPVHKEAGVLKHENTPLADRTNLAFMGTLVTGGQGLAVVVATGRFTEVGLLQTMLTETQTPKTPIEKQLALMGNQLVAACGAVCGVVFGIGFVRGYGLVQMLKMSISLAASAVPEGLPAAATINFAMGITDLRRQGVLVRRLQAVETLGAVQTVCLDDPGTITCNRMSVSEIVAGGRRHAVSEDLMTTPPAAGTSWPWARSGTCSPSARSATRSRSPDAHGNGEPDMFGSSTEKALARLAVRAGIDIVGLQDDFNFLGLKLRAENRLYMSSLHSCPSQDCRYIFTKGSPHDVLDLCDRKMVNGRVVALSEERRQQIHIENDRMAGRGLRVLGFAFNRFRLNEDIDESAPMVWLGLAGMVDPMRTGVEKLIEPFHRAGIDTVMITGDQSATAHVVARDSTWAGKPLKMLDSASHLAGPGVAGGARQERARLRARQPGPQAAIVQAFQQVGRSWP